LYGTLWTGYRHEPTWCLLIRRTAVKGCARQASSPAGGRPRLRRRVARPAARAGCCRRTIWPRSLRPSGRSLYLCPVFAASCCPVRQFSVDASARHASLCANLWMTCANTQEICVQHGDNAGDSRAAASMAGPVTWENTIHALCMEENLKASTRIVAMAHKKAERLPYVYLVVIRGRDFGVREPRR
jgi:hypothetical protein